MLLNFVDVTDSRESRTFGRHSSRQPVTQQQAHPPSHICCQHHECSPAALSTRRIMYPFTRIIQGRSPARCAAGPSCCRLLLLPALRCRRKVIERA